ncbi:MAG: hypothetical protein H0U44_09445 [Flavisolibacter sp.]|jgi:hypothetical protein|nr:hypothetical protein [Flavisolibacter sp.]
MKAIILSIATLFLFGFKGDHVETVNGLWTGIYRVDETKEPVVVKFEEGNQVEIYCGPVEEANKCMGTYKLQGDSLLIFTYTSLEGSVITMKGSINKRKTYVDGHWQTEDKAGGSFYIRKEKIRELFIHP